MTWVKIGLIGAMAEEIQLIEERLEGLRATEKAGIRFMEGRLNGKDVVLCKSGVGKVNAAVCTQLLIDTFDVDAIVFTGVAGALAPELSIGDIVISTDCQQHDVDVTALGFPRGTIPFAEQSVFPAHPALVDLAYEASRVGFEGLAVKGRVLSGDQFIASRETVRQLHEELQGACTEMEGAAVAQVCAMNGVPYVVIRSMSDKADGSAHVNFAEFTVLASRHSYTIVDEMLKRM
ncbi:5'-methylthioadenosine/adenosylhomocysteine nucleosidase [Paenibacillus koleovorans]|uniref:5'-methylthioadenosine/adenosylhomocysteine nucleosidase n=1 Tax=Paenibacillus koleovorans TaxID=121608 RepID=UPI000FD9E644|nr:5'-methylthioadenosine/adenosylhomocysteine nucleosidase [Paenibacillus koleovorans]